MTAQAVPIGAAFLFEEVMKQGKALRHNIGIAKWYNAEIQKLCREMFDDTAKELTPLYAKYDNVAMDGLSFDFTSTLNKLIKKFVAYFKQKGEALAKEFIKRQIKYTDVSVRNAIQPLATRELKFALKGSIINERNKDVVKLAIYNNVSLIRSLPERYFRRIVGMVTRSLEYGGSLEQLKQELLKIDGVTERQAKLIAYDQTRKVYSDISLNKLRESGITRVKWIHSHGDKVPRCYHVRKWDGMSGKSDGRPNGLNGYVFDINKPPVIQKAEGKRPEIVGYPAELINCTCLLVPVIDAEIAMDYSPNQPRDGKGRFCEKSLTPDNKGSAKKKIKTRYKHSKKRRKSTYPPCGRKRLDSALAQSLSSSDEKGVEHTKYVIDYEVKFTYNDVLDYDIIDWKFIEGQNR